MIKSIQHIILIILIIAVTPAIILSQYTLDNTGGKIVNAGTIKVKNGATKALPDTIGGRIEFLQPGSTGQQSIPNIVYNQLVIANTSLKLISDERKDGLVVRPLIVLDSLIVSDSADFTNRWIGLNSEEVEARSAVKNTALYSSSKDLVLNADDKAQDLIGDGSFSRIRIQNRFGVDVRGGGFRVNEKLTLKEGELRNDRDNNFTVKDSARVVRHTTASLAYNPNYENSISIEYYGPGDLTTGPEIPQNDKVLNNLYVDVEDELWLNRNVQVEDTLYINSIVNAYNDTLTLNTEKNPIYGANQYSQIDGSFRRPKLAVGDTIIFNSPYNWAFLPNDFSKFELSTIVNTVRARNFHTYPLSDEKVKRSYEIAGFEKDGKEVKSGFNMQYGFTWKYMPNQVFDESNDLEYSEMMFQRWMKDRWMDIESDTKPQLDFGSNWAHGFVEKLDEFGSFAIGKPSGIYDQFVFNAFVFLEGPYIRGLKGVMTHELWSRNLLQFADIAAYPLNLDTAIRPDFLTQIPDSVVDMVVLEFRKERNATADFVKTVFVRKDGRLVDNLGEPMKIKRSEGILPQGGLYYVAVRHRNHSDVITDFALKISDFTRDSIFLLTNPQIVEGGKASLRLVHIDDSGQQIYALKGGFLAEDEEGLNNQLNFLNFYTRESEHQKAFGGFTRTGYINYDYNLSGIINTKDFNVTWNNRRK